MGYRHAAEAPRSPQEKVALEPITSILLHDASASSAVRRTLATTGYAADDMGLGGPPHAVEIPPLRSPTLQHACQFVERPGWPDHDAISDQLEDQHRSGIHLQVFTHTSWNHHLTGRSNSRLREHAPLPRPSPPPRGYPGARVPQADREAQSRDRRNTNGRADEGHRRGRWYVRQYRCDDLLAVLLEPLVDPGPVQAGQEVVDVLGAGRAVLVVVGVLENVAGHQGNAAPDGAVVVLIHQHIK